MAIIEARQLRKEFRVFKRREGVWGAVKDLFRRDYETLAAVNGIDLSIEEGEFVGYIGPNGAGKSTTIKMMTGILVPTSGEIIANGFNPYQDRTRYTEDHWSGLWPTHPAVVGHRSHRKFQALAQDL